MDNEINRVFMRKRWSLIWHSLLNLQNNDLVNTGIWIGISNIINIIAVLIIQKVIALKVGPAGIALVGQYQNFLGITTTLANGGIDAGIVKYVAEFREKADRNALLISNASRITLFCSGILAISLVILTKPLSLYLLHTVNYTFVFHLLGLTITLFAANKLLISVLNGFGEIRKYAGSAITRSLVGLLLTVFLSWFWKLTGALIALTIAQSLVFFVTLFFVIKSPWFSYRFFIQPLDTGITRKLLAFSLMTITSAVLIPFVQILIRNQLIAKISVADAGYWDAIWKISQGYLGIITGALSVYYLPKLSSLSSVTDIRHEIWSGYKIIVPVLVLMFPIIYLLRVPIIRLLYSEQFIPTAGLFFPMLIGDFFKIISWLVAYLMLAKARTKLFIVTQIVFSIITYSLSTIMINVWGLQGVAWAYLFTYILYTIIVSYLLREFLF